jgi:hypothetical protein
MARRFVCRNEIGGIIVDRHMWQEMSIHLHQLSAAGVPINVKEMLPADNSGCGERLGSVVAAVSSGDGLVLASDLVYAVAEVGVDPTLEGRSL